MGAVRLPNILVLTIDTRGGGLSGPSPQLMEKEESEAPRLGVSRVFRLQNLVRK